MLGKLEIYVEGQRLDLFNDETVNIKSSLKDSMSPDKLFTSVSTSYTVPASKVNNKVFKHYYRTDLDGGIDARLMIEAELKLGGVSYRKGNVSLEKVSMKYNAVHSYSIRFYGSLTELTKRIGEDYINQLPVEGDDILTPAWYSRLQSGVDNSPAVVFPVASSNSRLIFHSTDSTHAQTIGSGEDHRNIAYVDSTVVPQYGLATDELVGAYKCGNLLDAIETKYGLTITGALRADYVEDYRIMLLGSGNESVNRTPITTGYSNESHYKLNRFNQLLLATISSTGIQGESIFNGSLNSFYIKVNTSSLATYKVHLLRDGDSIFSVNENTLGSFSQYDLTSEDGNYNYTFELEHSGGGTLTMDFYIKSFGGIATSQTSTQSLSVTVGAGSTGTTYKIKDNLPKLKVKDFLAVLFKQFNIATVVDGLNINTYHYDHFMSIGETVDITKYVDSSSSTIKPPTFYSGLSFKHEKPVTLMETTYFDTNKKEYGTLDYTFTSDENRVIGGVYEIKIPTHRIPTERLVDVVTDNSSLTSTFSLIDRNLEKVSTKPIFTYCRNVHTENIALNDGTTTIKNLSKHCIVTNAFFEKQTGSINLATIDYTAMCGNFWGAEYSEFFGGDRFSRLGNFELFWSNYIGQTFDSTTRSVELKAMLPLNVILNLEMNTRLVIGQTTYIIDSISTNFRSGLSSLKLTSISNNLLDNITAKTLTVPTNTSASNVRIVYLSSDTGLLEISSTYTVNAIGPIKKDIYF